MEDNEQKTYAACVEPTSSKVANANQALQFINDALAKLIDTNADNTDVIKFTMMDRCANYDELRER